MALRDLVSSIAGDPTDCRHGYSRNWTQGMRGHMPLHRECAACGIAISKQRGERSFRYVSFCHCGVQRNVFREIYCYPGKDSDV